jgi:parallel beta-helix repeat protein
VIRDNVITATGFPLGLWADQEDAEAIQIEDNLIERNRIMGGVVGIALNRASGNRILDNTISGITVGDPSLGEANGAGLWLSPASDGNEIAANIFEDIASDAVVLEGDSNRVELRSTSDRVRDLGSANRVSGPGSSTEGVTRVAPPTGDMQTDRASILAALGEVRSGDTVQFGPGTYLVGEIIRISTPHLTLLGHAAGTVLRGCHPEQYEALEWEAMRARPSDLMAGWKLMSRCGMLELTGGHVTIRDLTFEYTRMGLILGCCEGEDVLRSSEGGYLVEGNTFRNNGNSIRALLSSPEPTVIRGNRFINTFHALSAGVSHVHMVNNDISVPDPRSVPGAGHPGFAIGIRPPLVAAGSPADAAPVCQHNIIAGNRIQGHPDGIVIRVYEPGTSCRDNTIRDNGIDVRRVPIPTPWVYADAVSLPAPDDSTFTGVPLGLINLAVASGSTEEDGKAGGLTDTRLEGNRILGADGIGIEILNAARNRIAGTPARVPEWSLVNLENRIAAQEAWLEFLKRHLRGKSPARPYRHDGEP